MKALFICNQNKHRSKTAELMFKNQFETKSKGIYNNLFTDKDLEWADIIFVMEEQQRNEIGRLYPKQYLKKRIINLEIPDMYSFNQPELIEILKKKTSTIHQLETSHHSNYQKI